jgi:hypothetical protein
VFYRKILQHFDEKFQPPQMGVVTNGYCEAKIYFLKVGEAHFNFGEIGDRYSY